MYNKTVCDALGRALDSELGPDKAKALCQDLALVLANHKLTRRPELCEKVFGYMSGVVLAGMSGINHIRRNDCRP